MSEIMTEEELRDEYILYVEGKIEIDEMPMTFEQWKIAEEELAD